MDCWYNCTCNVNKVCPTRICYILTRTTCSICNMLRSSIIIIKEDWVRFYYSIIVTICCICFCRWGAACKRSTYDIYYRYRIIRTTQPYVIIISVGHVCILCCRTVSRYTKWHILIWLHSGSICTVVVQIIEVKYETVCEICKFFLICTSGNIKRCYIWKRYFAIRISSCKWIRL